MNLISITVSAGLLVVSACDRNEDLEHERRTEVLRGLFVASACEHHASKPSTAANTSTTEATLRQEVLVDGTGFHPSGIHVRVGQGLTLVFHRVTDATCAKQVVFKDLGITRNLPLNQEIEVNLTATTAPIAFACPRDMLGGAIIAQ